MQFTNKIRFACGIIGFVDIGTDRSCTPNDLIHEHTPAFMRVCFIANSDYM